MSITKDLSAPLCPCCARLMRNTPAHNALSRFRDIYICSQCGVTEALQGDFWRTLYEREHEAIHQQQDRWRSAHRAKL